MFARRILVPTDFSDCSSTAVDLAVALANGAKETSVVVLHVVEPTVPSYDDELGVLEPEVLKTEFEVLAASREHDVKIDAEVRHGDPAKEILKFADVLGVDLIVMGTHGRSGVLEMIVGNTTEHVMRNAKCPVLTVRDDSIVPMATNAAH